MTPRLLTVVPVPVIGDDCKEISLTKGYKTIVDARDYDWLKSLGRWHAQISPPVYAVNCKDRKKTGVVHRMHRLIYEKHVGPIPEGYYVDHINHDSLDNRLCNLRAVTNQQNQFNQKLHGRNKSGYRGVCWHQGYQRWRACIRVHGKHHHIGNFATRKEAALAYNKRALELQGEFAVINDIPEGEPMIQVTQPPAIVQIVEPTQMSIYAHRGSGRKTRSGSQSQENRIMIRVGREVWDEDNEAVVSESLLLDCTISNGMTPEQIAAKHARGYSLIDHWTPEADEPF